MECKCAELSQTVCVCVCVHQAVVNPLQGLLDSCHSSRNISPGFSSLVSPWAASTVWKARWRAMALAPTQTQRPSLIPSEVAGQAWAPCCDILGRVSNNPEANYP